jgi:uncharacterized BrkB/YihY/UPF0761 family membrane protein
MIKSPTAFSCVFSCKHFHSLLLWYIRYFPSVLVNTPTFACCYGCVAIVCTRICGDIKLS